VTAVGQARRVVRVAEPPSQARAFRYVVRRCLRDQRRSPLTWGIPLGLLSALELAIYPSVEKSMGKMLASYPEALKKAFNIQTMHTPAEFLNGEMFSLIIPLAIGFFAIRAATRAISGHEERHWLDTALAAPLRRRTLVAGAFAASGISTAAILVVSSVLSWTAGEIAGAVVPAGDLAAATLGTWVFAMFFAGLGSLAAGRLGSWGAVTGVAAGTLVAMYVIDITSRIADGLRDIGPISAFHYYGSPLINGIDVANSGLLLGAALAMAALGAYLFEHRDIHG
jgi:ABC-2 type transport system permease protein